jgi:hypothetical protein
MRGPQEPQSPVKRRDLREQALYHLQKRQAALEAEMLLRQRDLERLLRLD